MQLRLTYAGLLLGTGNKSRPAHVHDIRRAFHPQLKHFWSINPWLAQFVAGNANDVEGHAARRFEKIVANFSRCDYRFAPLVRREEDLLCSLEILFLRAGRAGSVLKGGDLDNRLSTLFDALSVPSHCEQMADHPKPHEGEDPFFCLLEDDSLVTQATIDTGELLEETSAGLDRNAARVVVTVKLSPQVNLGYGRLA